MSGEITRIIEENVKVERMIDEVMECWVKVRGNECSFDRNEFFGNE